MASFILFDRKDNTLTKFNGEDWFLDIRDVVQAANPQGYPVPVNEAETKHRYEVFFGTTVLERALEKVKTPEAIQAALADNGSVAGRIFIDVPVVG